MSTPQHSSNPPLGIGLASVILGSVGGLLFFLPILCIPLGIVGLAFGSVGLLLALFGRGSSLRWSVAGILVSGLALGTGILIGTAPAGYLHNPAPPAVWQHASEHPYVPPPAHPGVW